MAPHIKHQSRCSSGHRRWQQTWHSRSLNTNTNLEIALRDNELMDLSTIPQKMETPRQPTASPWPSCITQVERRRSIKWHQSMPICFTTWPSLRNRVASPTKTKHQGYTSTKSKSKCVAMLLYRRDAVVSARAPFPSIPQTRHAGARRQSPWPRSSAAPRLRLPSRLPGRAAASARRNKRRHPT